MAPGRSKTYEVFDIATPRERDELLVLPVCSQNGEGRRQQRAYNKKVSFEMKTRVLSQGALPGGCRRHFHRQASKDSQASSDPGSCTSKSTKSEGSPISCTSRADTTPRTSCTPRRCGRRDAYRPFRPKRPFQRSPKESHRLERRREEKHKRAKSASKCDSSVQTSAPSATHALKAAYAKAAGKPEYTLYSEPLEKEYVDTVSTDEAVAVARYKVLSAQKDLDRKVIEPEIERLIGTSLHVAWAHLKDREARAATNLQRAERIQARDLEMQSQFLREMTALRDRIRKFPDGVTEAMEVVMQEERNMQQGQQSISRPASRNDNEAVEHRVEYYEPLMYLEEDMRLLVLNVVDEKLKMIFTYDPDCRDKVDTMSYAVFEQQLTTQRLEQHRKENKRLSDELRDLNIKYHEAQGEIERLLHWEDTYKQVQAAANLKAEEDLAAAEERHGQLEEQLRSQTDAHIEAQRELQAQNEEQRRDHQEVSDNLRRALEKQKQQIYEHIDEKKQLQEELHAARRAKQELEARQKTLEKELGSARQVDHQPAPVLSTPLSKKVAHLDPPESQTQNSTELMGGDNFQLDSSDHEIHIEATPEQLESILEETTASCGVNCRMVKWAYRELQSRFKCLETERGLLSLERNELADKIIVLEQNQATEACPETVNYSVHDDEEARHHAALLADSLLDVDPLVRKAAMKSLAAMGKHAVPQADIIATALVDDDHEVRKTAVRTLASLGEAAGQVAASTLAETLKHDNWQIRLLAAEALGGLKKGGASHAHVLVEALQDSNAKVRRAAAKALGDVSGDAKPKTKKKATAEEASLTSTNEEDSVWSITPEELESQMAAVASTVSIAGLSQEVTPEHEQTVSELKHAGYNYEATGGLEIEYSERWRAQYAEADAAKSERGGDPKVPALQEQSSMQQELPSSTHKALPSDLHRAQKAMTASEVSDAIARASKQGHVRSGQIGMNSYDPSLSRKSTLDLQSSRAASADVAEGIRSEDEDQDSSDESESEDTVAPLSRFQKAVKGVSAVRALRQSLGTQQRAALAADSRIQSLHDEIHRLESEVEEERHHAADEAKNRELVAKELNSEVKRRSDLETKVLDLERALQAQVHEATIHVLAAEAAVGEDTAPVVGDNGNSSIDASAALMQAEERKRNEAMSRKADIRIAMLRSQLELMQMEHSRLGDGLSKAHVVNNELKKELRKLLASSGSANDKAAFEKLEARIAALSATSSAPKNVHDRLYHDAKLKQARLAAHRKLNNGPAVLSSPANEVTQLESCQVQPRQAPKSSVRPVTAAQASWSSPELEHVEPQAQLEVSGPRTPMEAYLAVQARTADYRPLSSRTKRSTLTQKGDRIELPLISGRRCANDHSNHNISRDSNDQSNPQSSRDATPERSSCDSSTTTSATHHPPRRPPSHGRPALQSLGVAPGDTQNGRDGWYVASHDNGLQKYVVRGRRPSPGSQDSSPTSQPGSSAEMQPKQPSNAPPQGRRPRRVVLEDTVLITSSTLLVTEQVKLKTRAPSGNTRSGFKDSSDTAVQ